MRKKLILFLMLALFGSTSFLRADEVTIGDPTSTVTNVYLPTYSLYNFSFTQQIYTADEIGMGGSITEFTMWLKNSSSYARNLNVYMKEVSESAFADGNAWVSMTDADLVATGTLANAITSPVETTFTLTTPFNYSGNGNLVICFQDVTGSWSSGAASVVMTSNATQAIYAYRDAALYDPTTPGVTGTTIASKSVVRLTITGSGPVPPTPGEGFAITPNEFVLGYRPTNGWMEPFTARISGAEYAVEASISNTSGYTPFILSEEINGVVPEEGLEFNVLINTDAPDDNYVEEFTVFYAAPERDIITVPVTAFLYTADSADIVEACDPIYLSYTGGVATFDETQYIGTLYPNYNLFGMDEMLPDAVFSFELSKDSYFSVTAGDAFIGIYTRETGVDFHPTAATEPVAMVTDGEMAEQLLLAGRYYMIVASNNITTVEGQVEQLPAPEELTFINPTPADGATEVNAPVTIKWEGGDNATWYQVMFSTSPVDVMDPIEENWIQVDENYGTYVVNNVLASTQYFFKLFAKNSNGMVETERRGFTTTLTAPYNVNVSEDEIFTDGSTLIKWKHSYGVSGFEGELTVADGTETSSYIPVYGLWMDDYTRGEMIYPEEMLEEMMGGEISSVTFYISSAASGPWSGDVFNVYLMEAPAATLASYYTSANATIVYTGALDGQGTTMTINFDTPYTYEGGNLLLGIEETTCGTYKSCSFYGITATGASASGYSSSALSAVTFNQRNFLPKTTFTCGDAKGIQNRNFLGYNVYYGVNNAGVYEYTKANDELIQEKQFLLSNLAYNMDGYDINVTAVYSEGESGHSAPNDVTVLVSGYGSFSGTVTELISGTPVANVAVDFYGMDEFGNPVSYNATTNANGAYTINNVKAGNYNIGTASLEGMETANMEQSPAVVEHDQNTVVDFVIHELYNPVYKVFAQELDPSTAKVTWSLFDFDDPVVPGGNGGNGGGNTGNASTFEEGFEGGMPAGWNVIDANNDGNTWCMTSAIPTTWTYYASLTLDWYRTGTNAICSGSYINGIGALTPDEYLVTPQVTLANGSTFSFWAAATDASYPADHFGVFVSDNGTSDWTMVNEWTLTGKKGGNNGGRASRDGNGAKLGTWYNYIVDLSAFAGQKYIAIRHFNCNDQYIMCVDDIELTVGTKGNRAVQEYAVYRKAILKEAALVETDSVFFTTTTDTLYADFDWNNVEPGLYQYGVSAIYPIPNNPTGGKGNRTEVVIDFETGDFSQFPQGVTNSTVYPWTVVDGGHSGKAMKTSNGGVASSTSQIDATVVMPTEGTISFWALCMGEGTSTIWDKCIFELDGVQQFSYGANVAGWNEYTYEVEAGEHQLTWKYSKDSSVNPTGDYMMVDDIVLEYVGGEASNDDPVTPITWSNILPKDMETVVTVNVIVPDADNAEGTVVSFQNQFEGGPNFTATIDETSTLTVEEFYKGNYTVTATLPGYSWNANASTVNIWDETTINVVFNEVLTPVPDLIVSQTGFARWSDMLGEDRYAERYMVTLDGAYVEQTTDNYLQFDQNALEIGTTYTAGVAVVYTTGMSTYKTAQFTYAGCEIVDTQVEELTVDSANCTGMDVVLYWNGGNVTPPTPTPPTPPTGGTTYDFDDGTMQGWTTIDANNDGYDWVLGSQIGGIYLVSGASLAGSGHNSSQDLVCSGSYSNATGAAITPNNYLVSPAKAEYTGISFWACGQDASYVAEHFGVAVSTASNTNASDFTIVNEWTMTAKGDGAMSIGRDGQTRAQGTWREYTVDLSAYAGQQIWVAIRHFNCSDMFILDVDDITLNTPDRLAEGTIANAGQGFGAINYDRDGLWYYYDNGTNYDAIGLTSGGGFYWGIMFPAGTFEGNSLTKISYFDPTPSAGTVTIYQGGTSAPGTPLYTQNYTTSGIDDVVEIVMDQAVEVDNTQNIWVIMHNTSGQYVASYDGASPGQDNGSWLSTDGSTWYTSLYSATGGQYGGNWNIRAYVEVGAIPGGEGANVLTPNKFNILVDGEVVGVTNQLSYTYTCPDHDVHYYAVVWVDINYNVSCLEEVEYQILPLSVSEFDVVNAIYPNPTSGDIRIEANAMTRISVVNALGQMVYDEAVKCDETVLNMAQFGNGVYMVRIATENGTSVKRVVVNK